MTLMTPSERTETEEEPSRTLEVSHLEVAYRVPRHGPPHAQRRLVRDRAPGIVWPRRGVGLRQVHDRAGNHPLSPAKRAPQWWLDHRQRARRRKHGQARLA